MTSYDLIRAAGENLWRLRLRSSLTIAGIVIAIGAFVAMLSFGAGNKKQLDDQFEKFGLLTTMNVYPKSDKDDSTHTAVLDDSALVQLSAIPGVRLAYPLRSFLVTVAVGDTVRSAHAQSIPHSGTQTRLFSQLEAGKLIDSDSAKQALITRDFVRQLGFTDPDSAIGRTITVTARLVRIDSAFVAVFKDKDGALRQRLKATDLDSLFVWDYSIGLLRREAVAALGRFLDGLMNAREAVTESLTIAGVLSVRHEGMARVAPLVIPVQSARRLNAGDIAIDPENLFDVVASGSIDRVFSPEAAAAYPRVTLDLDPKVPLPSIRDSVRALGFRTDAFAEQFDEIQRAFLFFDLALALVGLIALTTASLGITNTMFMSVLERRREIGVLKALGADDSDVRRMFVYEAAAIGVLGSIGGIILGWLISRLASYIAQSLMERFGELPFELFDLPIWLIGAALVLGTLVAVLAGYYPARRAARLDPIAALRND